MYALVGPVADVRDCTRAVLEALFPVFPEQAVPKPLEYAKLKAMLNAPLVGTVPVPAADWSTYDALFPGLFVQDNTWTARQVSGFLFNALQLEWPEGDPSEKLHVSFWDHFDLCLPDFLGIVLRR